MKIPPPIRLCSWRQRWFDPASVVANGNPKEARKMIKSNENVKLKSIMFPASPQWLAFGAQKIEADNRALSKDLKGTQE
jgi:hypothetical protein